MSAALLLLLLGVSGTLAAPSEPASPFLEGLDDFLAAFDGLALPGDPVAEAAEAGRQEPLSAPVQEPEIVTEVRISGQHKHQFCLHAVACRTDLRWE